MSRRHVLAGALTCMSLFVLPAAAAAEWDPPVPVSPAGHVVPFGADLHVDGQGAGVAAWRTSAGGVYYAERAPGAAWSAAQLLESGTPPTAPVVGGNASGDAVIAWEGAAGLRVAHRPLGGGFGAPVTVVAGDLRRTGAVLVTPAGDVHVASEYPDGPHFVLKAASRTRSSGWTAPQTIALDLGTDAIDPAFALDDDGPVLAFAAYGANPGFLWTTLDSAGMWIAPQQVPTPYSDAFPDDIQVAARGGTLVVGYSRQESGETGVLTRRGGVWDIHEFPRDSDRAPLVDVAVDAAGTAYAAWAGVTTSWNRVLTVWSREPGASWVLETELVPPADDDGDPSVRSAAVQLETTALDVDLTWGLQDASVWHAEKVGGVWSAGAELAPGSAVVRRLVTSGGRAFALIISANSVFEYAESVVAPADGAPVVTGTPAAGQTLTCDPQGFTGSAPLQYAFEWLVDSTPVPGEIGATYVVRPEDAYAGIACRVTASNSAGSAVAVSEEVVVQPVAPSNATAPTLAGTAEVGELVTCTLGTWSGSPVPALDVQWLRDGSPIAGETADTYEVRLADGGHTLACRVTATNDAGSASATTAAVTVPATSIPVNQTAPALTGPSPAGIGAVLTCEPGTWTGAPTPTLAIDWLRDGVVIAGEYASTYVVAAADSGHTLRCRVEASNVAGTSTALSNTRTIPLAPENTRLPNISGTLALGQTLTCSNGGWRNGVVSFAYAWSRNGTPIGGEVARTYVLVATDAGAALTCTVTATNGGGSTSATSASRVLEAPPTLVTAPSVSGTPRPTRRLTCDRGTWNGARSFTREWLRDGVPIAGQTGTRYTVAATDVGHVISCRITATNRGGSLTATSNGLTIVP